MAPLRPMAFLKKTDGGLILFAHVRPGAKKSSVDGIYGERLKISLKAPPVDGKANEELCRFLAELSGIPKRNALLLSGQTSRDKTVVMRGAEYDFFSEVLNHELD